VSWARLFLLWPRKTGSTGEWKGGGAATDTWAISGSTRPNRRERRCGRVHVAEGESERRWDGIKVAASARRRKQGKARGSPGFSSPVAIVPVTHRNVVHLIRGAKPQALVDLSAIVGVRGGDGGSSEQLQRRRGVPVPRAGHLGVLRRVRRDCGASASMERRCCAPSCGRLQWQSGDGHCSGTGRHREAERAGDGGKDRGGAKEITG
jgi:hypothetical protein